MTLSKSERTRLLIIEKSAPIFNKNGYSGTSLSDLTKAIGMTKGAIYGHFESKEDLALEAFNYNVRFIIDKIRVIFNEIESPIAKLYALSNFYRTYYDYIAIKGGCPLLNVGTDSQNTNPQLFLRVKHVIEKLKNSIIAILTDGIEKGEIKKDINTDLYAGRIFSFIEGSVFTASMLKNESYLHDMMNHLDQIIQIELQT